ncbi:monocarboxylate transporter 9-like isoform X1 [Hylaeus volcanicus]|uniref:monocarboxylate transporter 9-like isoform X1 n=1 Tax=Hylaeus volcanicus TaxID=313075 RepID=UPI0023B86EBB|nr:monocarboxylate transporter 9-like isoform X1 [Hylaeus volcanicus]XP_053975254.1 monocarboxylate transporter 9-like isoform X1 [Hylaeus volcanicus]XP_053975264.1 monocarboxylate transporter 9-like isoform X1 [Hylaeus volcanicus]XP_053975273.1 monocarboxylate transporter 9-like isoform X1 [Hylaeus volcanicus]XP_053975282.1 monocarboxylate transporter 9-like isoform X1 [Hylaeus volcanicus]
MSRGETDRGWAWVIVAAVTIINLAILPIQQCYGLVFTDRFHSLGITATQTSFILHLNGTITCSLGLISGPMMKRFRFRTVGFFGGLTVAIGICMTAFAVSVPSIIITYCIIVGIGHGVMFPATTLALNTYFRKKRNLAMGFSVTLTGLGPILMPLLIAKLLENYATTGTLLILAGIAMHSLVGASLLKPFNENKITSITKGNDITESSAECNDNSVAKRAESLNVENETEVTNGGVNCELLSNDVERKTEDRERPLSRNAELANRTGGKRKILSRIFKHLDLDLLKDSRYVAVILGMGVSLVAETNFNAMIPFVLSELAGLERTSIATVMSIQAASDITGRLCVPLLAHKAGWTSRNLYVFSLVGSTLGRTILSAWGTTYVAVVCVALIIGVAKGTKAVFQALIIPDYVPLERLPAASGMQMVCNGILSIAIGPIIGLVHDSMNGYVGALHFTSFLSLSCIFMWYAGGFLRFKKETVNRREKEDTIQVEEDACECSA